MPEFVPTTAAALTEPVRSFLANPTQEGLFLHCVEDGVDVVLQVAGEAPAGFAADCASCGHRARFEKHRQHVDALCPMCNDDLPKLSRARNGEKFNVFSWRVSWPRHGYEGLGHGPTVDSGTFTDADILNGIAGLHSVLRLYLPLFESLNVTSMKDYRALMRLRHSASDATVSVGGDEAAAGASR